MHCPSCQHDNPEGAKFCRECGSTLQQDVGCPKCGTTNLPGSKFCNACGQRLGTAATTTDAEAARTPRAPLPAAFAAGRYQVQRFLGEGAKKRVYLARDTRLTRDVAVALIKTDGLDEPGRARVRREAQAMGQLGDDPHVVTVFDINEEGSQLLIVSEYMAGGDLGTRLREAPDHRLPVAQALRITDEVCQALEHAHRHGVIHRDLKPGNIWFTRDGQAALGDFGLAVSLDHTRLTQEGMMVGTAPYMPPEQALGRAPDVRSDLYALGATLYEMVAGRPPFVGDDAVAIISQHLNTPPVAPSWHNAEVLKPLDALILKLLAKDPAHRPAGAAEIRTALAAIAAMSAGPTRAVVAEEVNPLDRLAGGVFVGREREVEQLRAGVNESLSGKGRVLLLVGEPGIGKTRTSEELTTYARLRGAQVLWGRCYEGEGAPAFWPWVQVIRSYVHEHDPPTLLAEMGAGAAAIADVVSEVRQCLPGLQPAVPLEPEQARFRLFDAVTSFLKNASRQRLLVLVLDDLHWADKPSLLLLQFLAKEMAGSRLLVLGTYRDVELSRQHPLAEALAELARTELSQRVLLRGLSEPDVARFIDLTAGHAAPPALVAAVYRETEGNPFFIHEVVRLLAADGRLERAAEVQSWSVEIPQGIREVIGRRLNKLSEDCNRILTIASVIGREFELPMLERVATLAGDRVIEVLDEAVAARVVQEVPDSVGRYRFAHALVRETLYEELSTTRRVRLHREIGEMLEAMYGEATERHLAELAYHFAESAPGGDIDKAIAYATRAGERATAMCAYEDAIPQYERALQALDLKPAAGPAQRCDLLIALGRAQLVALDRDKACAILTDAIQLARVLRDPKRLARAAASYSFASWELGRPKPESVRLLEEALVDLGNEDSVERIRLLAELTRELSLGPTYARAVALSDEAIAVARRLGDHESLREALFRRLLSFVGFEDPQAQLDLVQEVQHLFEESPNPELELQLRGVRLTVFIRVGDMVAAKREFVACEPLLVRTQAVYPAYLQQLRRATFATLEGRFDEAESLAQAAFTFGHRVMGEFAMQMFGIQIAMLRIYQGRMEEVAAMFEAAAAQHAQPAWRCGVAAAYALLDREQEARRAFDAIAQNDFGELPWDFNWLGGMTALVGACAYLRDSQRAAVLYERLRPYANQTVIAGAVAAIQGSVHGYLGQLAATASRWADAEAHFDAALEADTRIGHRPRIALLQFQYAQMLLERVDGGAGAERDRQKALRLLNDALNLARDIGMPRVVNDALALKLQLQGIDSGDTQHSITAVVSQVQRERPNLLSHAAPDGTVTILFSDIEGSTQMTERLGDQRWLKVLREHNRIVREQVATHGGFEVKSQGDGFMIAFQSARRALQCAIAIQRAFAAYAADHSDEALRVRIGLHAGEVIKEADDFFGKNVILAARIAAQATGGEILVSSLVKELTHSSGDIRFGDGRETQLKGLSGAYTLHMVAWE